MKALVVDALASGKGERKATRDAVGAGARAIAGILETMGLKVTIIEAEKFLSEDYDDFEILFVSGMTTDTAAVRRVVSKRSRQPAIIGGPISSDPISALRRTRADIVVIGEGELTLIDLLNAGLREGCLPDSSELDELPGIAYVKDSEFTVNRLRPVMSKKSYNSFKPSTSTIKGYRLYYAARVYLEVLRGCSNYRRAWNENICSFCDICRKGELEERYNCPMGLPPGCGYCSVPSLYGPPKSRSKEGILIEAGELLNEGVSRIVLSAPCFLDYGRDLLVEPDPLTDPRQPEPNYNEIEKLLASLYDLPKVSEGMASIMIENLKASLVTEKAAKILGRYLKDTPVSIGFETGDREHSELLGRPSTPEETLIAIKRLRNSGVKPYVYFIHGLPGQSRKTVDETVKAIDKSKRNGAERIILYRFQSLPMSSFSQHPSAPPSISDFGSKEIHQASERVNMEIKKDLVGKRMRVVAAERYDKNPSYIVCYPLKHGPVVLMKYEGHIEGSILDIEVTDTASNRIVYGRLVAMF